MRPRLAIVSALFLFGLAAPRLARAHDELVSASTVEVGEREVRWKVDVGLVGLGKVVTFPVSVERLREADLPALRAPIAAALARGLAVTADGRALEAVPGALVPIVETADGPALARVEQTFTFTAPAVVTRLALRVAFFSELTANHRAVVRVVWNGRVRTFARLGPGEIALRPEAMVVSSAALARELLPWGVEHIFLGYDHVAFLLVLLLGVTRLREVIAVVTSFTVAHSLTLALSSAGLVRIPSRVSEALIAASIVYVAAENLGWLSSADRTARHRWRVTFLFGLVHGLGFATELRARLAELGGKLVVPVLSFNLGVELGQIAIVAIAWPLFAWLRRGGTAQDAAARQRRLARMGSVPILLLGLYWLAARLVG